MRGDSLLQTCIEEFGAAAIYVAGAPPQVRATTRLDVLRLAKPSLIWWVPAAAALDLIGDVADVAADSALTATLTATARARGIALTNDASFRARAKKLIDVVNKQFEAMKRSGEFWTINRSYRAARRRGDPVPPYATFIACYRRDLLRAVSAQLSQNKK